jgi:hypothetical protein
VAIRVKPNAAAIRRSRSKLAFKRAFEIELARKIAHCHRCASAILPPSFCGRTVRNLPSRIVL